MMNRTRFSALVVFSIPVFAALAGCSGIRVVKKTQTGGEVALSGNQDDAHKKAEDYMAGQCPNGYTIVEEGEAVVGQVTQGQSQSGRGTWGQHVTNSSSTSTDKREWRIQYQCNGAGGAPPAPPGAPPAAPTSGQIRTLTFAF